MVTKGGRNEPFLPLRRAVLFLRRTPLQPGSAHAASQDHNGRPAQPDSAGSNCTWGERHHSQHAGCPRGREMGNGGREASTAQGRPQGREVQLRTGPVCLLALRKAQLPFQRTVWKFPCSVGVQMGPSRAGCQWAVLVWAVRDGNYRPLRLLTRWRCTRPSADRVRINELQMCD